MKKILFLLLVTIASYGQTYQNSTFGTITTKTAPTTTADPYVGSINAGGVIGKVVPENIPVNVIPPTTHYTPVTPNLKGHFQGIDNAIGNIPLTTAGNTTRIWFTGDATTITAGTFYLTNPSNKGTVANVSQSVINDDNQKKYFTQDLIGQPFATATLFPPGVYAGNLSASTTPNSAQQRFTVELYKCNNAGTPIASGVPGAPVGDLGVTVILILDSGLLTLADGSVTNVPVSASLASQFSIAVGERIRYHVSAEKVGTASSNITESIWYGNSFNSFLDVPTPITSSGVSNLSTVTGATVTNALDNLNTGKANSSNPTFSGTTSLSANLVGTTPNKLTQIMATNDYWSIYGDATVTNRGKMVFEIGDDGVPIGSDGQSFEFRYMNQSSGTQKTPLVIDYSSINMDTNIGIGNNMSANNYNLRIGANITGGPTSGAIYNSAIIQSDVTTAAYYNRTNAETASSSFTLPALVHYSAQQGIFNSPSVVTNQYGFMASATLTGATNNYGFKGDVVSGTNNWNAYMQGTAPNYFNGGVCIGNTNNLGVGTLNVTGNVTTVAATTANHAVIKSQLDLKSDLASPTFTGDPKAPTPTAGDNDTSIATTAFVQANARPYKIYTALISQSGTSAPIATVLENTLGGTVVWTRTTTGVYVGTLSSAFPTNKTVYWYSKKEGTSPTAGSFSMTDSSTSTIQIATRNTSNTLADDMLVSTSVHIEAYP